MIYYQYELDENGIIIAIHSSTSPFESNQLDVALLELITFGKTKLTDLQ